jgi:hypothetical protein
LWIPACEKDNPKGDKAENTSPESYEKQYECMGQYNVNETKERSQE